MKSDEDDREVATEGATERQLVQRGLRRLWVPVIALLVGLVLFYILRLSADLAGVAGLLMVILLAVLDLVLSRVRRRRRGSLVDGR